MKEIKKKRLPIFFTVALGMLVYGISALSSIAVASLDFESSIYTDRGHRSTATSIGDAVIEVHNHHGNLYYNQYEWNHDTQELDTLLIGRKFGRGEHASIASADNWIVLTYKHNGKLRYNVGQLSSSNVVVWHTKGVEYDSGCDSSVDLIRDAKRKLQVVEVHNGCNGNLYYKIGIIDNYKIKWEKKGGRKFDTGYSPSIAMYGHDTVVEAHHSGKSETFYNIGKIKIDSNGKKYINWPSKGSKYGKGRDLDIAIINNTIMEVHNDRDYKNLYSRTGTLTKKRNTISWKNSNKYTRGGLSQLVVGDSFNKILEFHLDWRVAFGKPRLYYSIAQKYKNLELVSGTKVSCEDPMETGRVSKVNYRYTKYEQDVYSKTISATSKNSETISWNRDIGGSFEISNSFFGNGITLEGHVETSNGWEKSFSSEVSIEEVYNVTPYKGGGHAKADLVTEEAVCKFIGKVRGILPNGSADTWTEEGQYIQVTSRIEKSHIKKR